MDRVISWGPGWPEDTAWDLQLEVNELLRVFRSSLSSIPREIPYICVTEERIHWAAQIIRAPQPLRLGLCWQAGPWDQERSIPFDDLSHLLAQYRFFNLQKGIESGLLIDAEKFASDVRDTAVPDFEPGPGDHRGYPYGALSWSAGPSRLDLIAILRRLALDAAAGRFSVVSNRALVQAAAPGRLGHTAGTSGRGAVYLCVHISHDPAVDYLAPGSLLIKYVIERARAEGTLASGDEHASAADTQRDRGPPSKISAGYQAGGRAEWPLRALWYAADIRQKSSACRWIKSAM